MSQTMTTPSGQTALLATFFVRDMLCGLDATAVQEVIRLGPVTPVHYAPEEVLGILNLRGRIVTIVDLGLRIGLPRIATGSDSRIFIVEDRDEFIGLLVNRGEAGSFKRGVPRSRPGDYVARRRPRSGGGRTVSAQDSQ